MSKYHPKKNRGPEQTVFTLAIVDGQVLVGFPRPVTSFRLTPEDAEKFYTAFGRMLERTREREDPWWKRLMKPKAGSVVE